MGPLTGVKVVELGTYVAVPKAARMMADWGAEVIKVEAPGGEDWRRQGQNWKLPYHMDNNPIFHPENANKKSMVINLKDPAGKKVLFELLETADIFITNTRGKALTKLGLDYESLKEKFPKLIYAHLTGLGNYGPDKDRPGYDVTAFWAKSGILTHWAFKEFPPAKPYPGVGDGATGHALLAGIMAALYNRTRTGCGDKVNISLYGTALWMNSTGVIMGQPQYGFKFPQSIYETPGAFYPLYETKDGRWLLLSINWEPNVKHVLEILGLNQYIGDERFTTLEACCQNMEFICGVLTNAFKEKTSDELTAQFNEAGYAYEWLATPEMLANDEQAWANGYLRKVKLQCGEELVLPLSPVQFDSLNVDDMPYNLGPDLGADSNDILASLGYSSEEIAELNKLAVLQDAPVVYQNNK